MIQNHINKQYKIGCLSPTAIYNPNVTQARKQKRSFMSNLEDSPNFIEEDAQQEKISPKAVKNKSNSCDQIGVAKCKIFQKKIQIKKNQKVQSSFLKNDQGFNLYEGQNLQENEKKLNFSEQYRLNLRRTVYNETKIMIKQRKNKLKQKLYSIDPGMKKNDKHQSANTISIQISQKINMKHFIHKNKFKNDSQDISNNIDTMYKTLGKKRRSQAHAHAIHNGELDISKFPLINRSKHQNTLNYSNLLMTLDMKENYNKKEKSKAKVNRGSSRKSNFEKHEIKPWETYADQFMD